MATTLLHRLTAHNPLLKGLLTVKKEDWVNAQFYKAFLTVLKMWKVQQRDQGDHRVLLSFLSTDIFFFLRKHNMLARDNEKKK